LACFKCLAAVGVVEKVTLDNWQGTYDVWKSLSPNLYKELRTKVSHKVSQYWEKSQDLYAEGVLEKKMSCQAEFGAGSHLLPLPEFTEPARKVHALLPEVMKVEGGNSQRGGAFKGFGKTVPSCQDLCQTYSL